MSFNQDKNSIHFSRNGEPVSVALTDPTETLLDYLRLRENATGTKEGCCEGDCGACTVVVGELVDGEVHYKPINSCITLLGMVNGKDVISVDELADADGTLHPVQQAMIDKHGSQCGFCTPGFVMSLFSLYQDESGPCDRSAINTQLAGNLCRCTGYRPIVEAGISATENRDIEDINRRKAKSLNALTELNSEESDSVFVGTKDRFFAQPQSLDELADLYQQHPDATIVAGATDVGLWVTKHLADLPKVIHVGAVKGFRDISESNDGITIGGGATYEDAIASLAAIDPDIGDLIERIGSKQVRSAGTIGGNIANGSPIGDTPPLLIALDSKLILRKGGESRTIPLENFFIKYGQQDRQASEFVHSVFIPKLGENEYLRTYKLSKRFDQDISAVMMAVKMSIDQAGNIEAIRIAYGGMAETPKRASKTERSIVGKSITDETLLTLWEASFESDFAPISDMRASAEYRMMSAKGLLKKALIEIQAEISGRVASATRVIARKPVLREVSQ
jgi:xanthine dehydrogenase small subunit